MTPVRRGAKSPDSPHLAHKHTARRAEKNVCDKSDPHTHTHTHATRPLKSPHADSSSSSSRTAARQDTTYFYTRISIFEQRARGNLDGHYYRPTGRCVAVWRAIFVLGRLIFILGGAAMVSSTSAAVTGNTIMLAHARNKCECLSVCEGRPEMRSNTKPLRPRTHCENNTILMVCVCVCEARRITPRHAAERMDGTKPSHTNA